MILNSKSIDAASIGASINGTSIDISNGSVVSVQFIWSSGSSPVGDLIVQGSCDGTNFYTVASLSISANSGSYIYSTNSAAYPYIRAGYTRTSGTATLTAYVALK